MKLEFIVSYFMIALLPITGIIGIIICIMNLKNISKAEKLPATIVSFKHNGYKEKYLTYAVKIDNNTIIELRRLVKLKSSSNLLGTKYLGKEVTVPYDRERNKLYPHEPIVCGYLITSVMLSLFGCALIVFFRLL